MGCRHGQNGIQCAQSPVGDFETFQESGQRAGADRHMPTDLHVACSQRARDYGYGLPGSRRGQLEEAVGQRLAEPSVNLADSPHSQSVPAQPSSVDPGLNGDMGLRFDLQVAALRVRVELASERPFDVDWMRTVAFDEIAVVAIHHSHQLSQGLGNSGR